MFTKSTLAASIVAWVTAGAIIVAPSIVMAQEMDWGSDEEETAEPPEEEAPPPEEPAPAEVESSDNDLSPAFAFAVADGEDLAPIARELDSALRDVVGGDPRYSISAADNRLNGYDTDAQQAMREANELFQNGRRTYDNLELDEAFDFFEQALGAFEDLVAHVGDLNIYSDCLLYMGASEVLRGRSRPAATIFSRLLIIDPERRPDPDVFPPPVVEAFEYASTNMARIREGVLEVTSTPEGADLFVDGVFQGPTPQTLSGLKAGIHYVRVRQQGYTEAGQVVEVSSRRPTQVQLELAATNDGQLIAGLVEQIGIELAENNTGVGGTVRRLGEILGLEVLMTALVSRGDDGIGVQLNVWNVVEGRSLSRGNAGPFEEDPIIVAGDTPPSAQNVLNDAWSAQNVPQVVDRPIPPPTTPPPPPPPPRRPFWQQWWFWTAVGVVVAGAGVGIGFGVASATEEPGETPGEVILDL